MKNPSDIGSELAQLARKLAKDALGEQVVAETRLDIFKALTTYYVNTTKVSAKLQPDEDEGVPSIASLRSRVEQASTSRPGSSNPGPGATN